MEKYFTPDITDLCIGYECEVCWSRGYADNNWSPLTIGYKEKDGAYTNTLIELIHGLDDGYLDIRVPYLSTDQIEKEKWNHFELKYWRRNIGLLTYSVCIDPGSFEIIIQRIFSILQNGCRVEKSIEIFRGECKDINTFRKICKLLRIN